MKLKKNVGDLWYIVGPKPITLQPSLFRKGSYPRYVRKIKDTHNLHCYLFALTWNSSQCGFVLIYLYTQCIQVVILNHCSKLHKHCRCYTVYTETNQERQTICDIYFTFTWNSILVAILNHCSNVYKHCRCYIVYSSTSHPFENYDM